jgi:sporulation protein YlmC with PRC-barrel domain
VRTDWVPQVQVTPAQPQVLVQRPLNQEANVQVQPAQGQSQIRYEWAEPQVTVNQAQGQPNVRVERAEGQPAPAAGANQQMAATSTQPATTGTVAAGAGSARQFSVNQLEDMNVYNARGNQLGEVEDVLIGPNNQTFLVVAYGGFLGLGERQVVLPMDRFQLQNDRLIVAGMTEDQLRALPAYSRGAQGYRAAENDFRTELSPFRQ